MLLLLQYLHLNLCGKCSHTLDIQVNMFQNICYTNDFIFQILDVSILLLLVLSFSLPICIFISSKYCSWQLMFTLCSFSFSCFCCHLSLLIGTDTDIIQGFYFHNGSNWSPHILQQPKPRLVLAGCLEYLPIVDFLLFTTIFKIIFSDTYINTISFKSLILSLELMHLGDQGNSIQPQIYSWQHIGSPSIPGFSPGHLHVLPNRCSLQDAKYFKGFLINVRHFRTKQHQIFSPYFLTACQDY